MKRVYLCGPISGLTADDASNWRSTATRWLFDRYDLLGVSPMRGKDVLRGQGTLGSSGFPHFGPLLSEHAVFKRDRNDVRGCDALLANFTNSPRVSIGSMVEFGWADAWAKPIVAVVDKNHDHLFIREAALAICETLEEAVDALGVILA